MRRFYIKTVDRVVFHFVSFSLCVCPQLLPSLLSGADQYESPEVAAWERKHLRGFHAQDGEGENLFERGGSDAMRVLRGLLMTLLSDDETYSLRKKVDLHKYVDRD